MKTWMIKYFKYIPILIMTLALTITSFCLYQGDHYIEPYTGVVDDMPSDVYIVYPHKKSSKLSNKMYKEVIKLDNNDDIDYYLIDYDTYSTVLETGWGLQGFPTYYVFARREGSLTARMIYTSFGYRTYDALVNEIHNAVEYGLEEVTIDIEQTIDDNVTMSIPSFDIVKGQLENSSADAEIKNYVNFKINFLIKNKSTDEFVFDSSKVKILSSTDKSKVEYGIVEKTEQIPVLKTKDGYVVSVDVKIPTLDHNHLIIRYYKSSDEYVEWKNNGWYSSGNE